MLTIEIKTGNAAFGETPFEAALELAKMLGKIQDALQESGDPQALDGRKFKDLNGNTVAALTYTPD
jgi:hypothetical protein